MQPKTVAFIDQVGRTIIGEVLNETDSTLRIFNPVILHCQPQANGQLEVQTFPVFFFEFIDKANRNSNVWTFYKNNIVLSEAVLDDRILSQYSKINTPATSVEAPVAASPKIISINDL